MGRRCLAYDIHPVRPDIARTRRKRRLSARSAADATWSSATRPTTRCSPAATPPTGVADAPLAAWIAFLDRCARDAFATLRPGGHVALLLANQTEKDLPGRLRLPRSRLFMAISALIAAGFLPERRISCPMDGAYLPQHVRRARAEGRMLGQVRDLLVMRKPVAGRRRYGHAARRTASS